ncbi:uncharacterized protein [Lolium perenne]|uniref:uncharacterized protein n=1 Tax=Lolium perenne TaxID=4522 RepID=UPI0021EA9BFA|nr:myosin-4-like [Lolium perenne]
MTTSSLSSALSSMEVMLDALMQRGIGKPDDKPKEDTAPPALPTRPTVRGRPPSVHRPGSPAPWLNRPPLAPIPPPPQEEEEEERDKEKCTINLELEMRAIKAEEDVKQRDDDVRHKDEEISGLRQQVEHYESRLSECEAKMRAVEEELQRQIAALQQQVEARSLQMARSVASRPSTSCHHRRELSSVGITRAPQPPVATAAEEASSVKRPEQHADVVTKKNQGAPENLAEEFVREKQAFEHAAKAVAEVKPGTMSVDELRMLKRQFVAWRKEYATRLRKAKAELRKRVHSEKSHGHGHDQAAGHGGNQRRRWCGWWRTIKMPKFRAPKRCCTCAIKFPSPSSCCSCFSCCFRRHR